MSRLNAITDWIEKGRNAQYQATKLAALCRISESQLRRFFLERFSRPPQEWLNELRLWDALEILSQGHPVKYTASVLNFADATHFSHCFKRYFGRSPAAFAWVMEDGTGTEIGTRRAREAEPWVSARRRLLSPTSDDADETVMRVADIFARSRQ